MDKTYISRKDIAEFYGLSLPTVDRRIKELEKLAFKGHYPKAVVLRTGSVMVNKYALLHYMQNRELYEAGVARAVEKFDISNYKRMYMELA